MTALRGDTIIIKKPEHRHYWISFASVIASGMIWFWVGYFARPLIEAWLR